MPLLKIAVLMAGTSLIGGGFLSGEVQEKNSASRSGRDLVSTLC